MLEAKIKLLIADLEKTLIVLDNWEQSTDNETTRVKIQANREVYETVLTKLNQIT